MNLHNKPVVAGADTLAGSDAVRAPTPATTPTAAPEATARPVEQPDARPVPPTGPASTFDPDQARAAAAEVAYPEPRFNTRDALRFAVGPSAVAVYPTAKQADEADRSWMTSEAYCAGYDPDLFFPERGEDARPAKAVCMSGCPLLHECREHGLRYERFGVWGGLSERERIKIRRQRNLNRGAA